MSHVSRPGLAGFALYPIRVVSVIRLAESHEGLWWWVPLRQQCSYSLQLTYGEKARSLGPLGWIVDELSAETTKPR